MEKRPFPFTPLDMAWIGARWNVGRCRGKADETPQDQAWETFATTLERMEAQNEKNRSVR